MFEKVSYRLKYDSKIVLVHKHTNTGHFTPLTLHCRVTKTLHLLLPYNYHKLIKDSNLTLFGLREHTPQELNFVNVLLTSLAH